MRYFLDYQPEYREAKWVIIPAGYENASTGIRGSASAPSSIIQASSILEEYEPETETEPYTIIYTLPEDELPLLPENAIEWVEEKTEEIINEGKKPILIGGEHTLTLGVVRALKKKYEGFLLLSLDAHADMRDEYGKSKINHATVMRRISEVVPVAIGGIRSYSREEKEYMERNGIKSSFSLNSLLDIKGKYVYISIDMDVFDPSLIPDVGVPEPGGVDWKELTLFLKNFVCKREIIGFDIMELSPRRVFSTSSVIAAKLLYKMVAYIEKGG